MSGDISEGGGADDGRAVLVEPLRSRWSPSVFDPDHTLGPDEVTALLRAAQWAPSAGNSQPWRYVVAPRGSAAHAALLPHLSRGNAGWVPRAALVLLAGAQVADDPEGPEGNGPKSAVHARYDLGQASAHVTVQAASMGLHVHQFAGFDHAAAAADLGVPAHVALMTGLAVGRHLEEHDGVDDGRITASDRERERRPRTRRPLEEIAFGARWGQAWGEAWTS